MKDAGLRIRVQRELREQFVQVCRSLDRSAAQVLREFMRAYVRAHAAKALNPEHGDKPTPPALR